MNVRHLPKNFKEKLINKYKGNALNNFEWDNNLHNKFGNEYPNLFVNELMKDADKYWIIKALEYLDTLGKHRGIDWRKIWGDVVNVW